MKFMPQMETPETSSHSRYPVLDGVRGTAILYVTFSHLSNKLSLFFSGQGQYGVWLFFVLSGFLLSLYFFRSTAKMFCPWEWLNYAFRRIVRIYPLYTLSILLCILFGYWSHRAFWPVFLLRTPAVWAVFVEFKFYLVLPFVILLIGGLGMWRRWAPFVIFCFYLCLHYSLFPTATLRPGYDAFRIGNALVGEYAPLFVMGALTAWVYAQTGHWRPRLSGHAGVGAVVAVLFLLPVVCSATVLNALFGLHVAADYYHMWWVPWGLVFSVFLYGVMMSDGVVSRFLSSPFMRFFGFVSFSTYLFQDFWIDFLIRERAYLPEKTLRAVLTLGLIYATSALSFVLLERPLSRLSLLAWRR